MKKPGSSPTTYNSSPLCKISPALLPNSQTPCSLFSMISSKLRNPSPTFSIFRNTSIISANSLPLYSISLRPRRLSFELTPLLSISPSPSPSPSAQLVLRNDSPFELVRASKFSGEMLSNEEGNPKTLHEVEDLSENSVVYKKTLALVECSMFAALTGLVYFLSNSLALENYFGFFFSLPVVISSMRWGIAAGRKTMVSTFLLLLVLSGPVKALTYLLKHGIVGFTMGTLWRCGADWSLSIFLCTILRSTGALGYVIITSFLIRENILALITINIHASLTFLFTASGVNTIPSMEVIYVIFGTLVLLNSGCFMFLLHLLYSVFLSGIGMRASLALPKWLEKAI